MSCVNYMIIFMKTLNQIIFSQYTKTNLRNEKCKN